MIIWSIALSCTSTVISVASVLLSRAALKRQGIHSARWYLRQARRQAGGSR
jgi:hypothetical protein